VFHLIIIMFVMAVVFIGGFFVTVSSWELHLIPLIVVAVYVCKYLKTVLLISSSFFLTVCQMWNITVALL
jgi:hypothetical protein